MRARRSAPLLLAAPSEAADAPGCRRRTADAGAALRHVRRPGDRARGLCRQGAEALPVEQAALLACGFSTGAGAALWATPVREGSDVAVIGCGGVGLAVVQGALLRGAARIFAVDVAPDKLEHARNLGATDAVDASSVDPVEAVRELTGGRGSSSPSPRVGAGKGLIAGDTMCAIPGTATAVGMRNRIRSSTPTSSPTSSPRRSLSR
jgi:S-(hydroxymethyl)glutathione dehydrogenase/alcohol dehydrogenase